MKSFENHRFKAYNQNHWAAMAQVVKCHRVSVKVSLSKTEPPIDPSLPLTKREKPATMSAKLPSSFKSSRLVGSGSLADIVTVCYGGIGQA